MFTTFASIFQVAAAELEKIKIGFVLLQVCGEDSCSPIQLSFFEFVMARIDCDFFKCPPNTHFQFRSRSRTQGVTVEIKMSSIELK